MNTGDSTVVAAAGAPYILATVLCFRRPVVEVVQQPKAVVTVDSELECEPADAAVSEQF